MVRGAGKRWVDATHWSAVGALDTPDPEIVRYATTNGFVVLTHDLDFGAILAATGERGPSVVQIRADDVSPFAIGSSVVGALRQMSTEIAEGALVTIEPGRTRLTILPLKR